MQSVARRVYSYLKLPLSRSSSKSRQWRQQSCQPFADIEDGVLVAPSAVAGLGLYTTKEYEDGDFICYYSGECVNCVKGNKSKYLMEFDWYNKDTKGYEKWWLDSAEKGNRVWTTAARSINDPCSTYGDSTDVPDNFRTEYSINCVYGTRLSDKPDPVIGQYVGKVFAVGWVPAFVELFTPYGTSYWKRFQKYFKTEDPDIVLNNTYDDSKWLKDIP